MYVSSWPGLTFSNVLTSRAAASLPYPLNAPRRNAFCVARSGIYHLVRALKLRPEDTVLAPDYYSGNEVGAMQAAGAKLVHYPIRRNFEPDLAELERLVRVLKPRVVYVIHYLGWPQPMEEILALCRLHGSILVEDCALSMLSSWEGTPLGTLGNYSVFCLYKSLPVPNGGLLVQNTAGMPGLTGLQMEPCPLMGSIGRSAELALETVRSRSAVVGRTISGIKQTAGRMLRRARVRHVPVGDIGWNIGNVNVAMSPVSDAVMAGLDYDAIRRKRRENFQLLNQELRGAVATVRDDLNGGVCPLFFPILVKNKREAVRSLQSRGIGAVDFWNDRQDNPAIGKEARHLRAHLMELPIHQEVSRPQIEYMAREVRQLRLEPAPC
jgi:dTDP-4-amino-4,6-dideoxygalactose transaminase